jgi:hypothetical protein
MSPLESGLANDTKRLGVEARVWRPGNLKSGGTAVWTDVEADNHYSLHSRSSCCRRVLEPHAERIHAADHLWWHWEAIAVEDDIAIERTSRRVGKRLRPLLRVAVGRKRERREQ